MAKSVDASKSRIRYLAVLAIALFVSAAIAGIYSFGMMAPGRSTTAPLPILGTSTPLNNTVLITAVLILL